MTRTILLLSFLVASAAAKPSFEVASIVACKPGTPPPPGEHAGMVQFIFPGGRFQAHATTIKYLLEWAYGLQPSQHSSGPAWFEGDRFDIDAKAAASTSDLDMKYMAQSLLEERFHLKYRRESKEAPVLILSAGKTAPKLYPPKPDEQTSMKMEPLTGENQKIISYRIVATRFSFAQLNLTFARVLDRVIVNQTGLQGDFDFSFDLSPDTDRPNPMDPDLLIAALRDQLGLTVKSQKAPVDYLVIENIDRTAAGN